MLDAALNGIVVEKFASVCKPRTFTFVAIHDAWLLSRLDDEANGAVDWSRVPEGLIDADGYRLVRSEIGLPDGPAFFLRGEALLNWILADAAREWFESLEVVYDDLIRYLGEDNEFGPFVRGIKKKWQRRLEACRTGREPWPTYRVE
jgi:hypothetical protein